MLRKKGVVGKFVEFFGPGVASLALADRATIGNMSPEYGATCAIFPVDQVTLDYLRFTGRPEARVALVEAYMKEQGLFHTGRVARAGLHRHAGAGPQLAWSRASPGRGARRTASASRRRRRPSGKALPALMPSQPAPAKAEAVEKGPGEPEGGRLGRGERRSRRLGGGRARSAQKLTINGDECEIDHGSVVIAAITSCTNTSNPSVMIAAGLLARKAVEKGLKRQPWVKTSLAPGSKVVTEYYEKAGLQKYLDQLGFQTVGYGCTTCIGNSGPLPPEISEAVQKGGLVVASVLSGQPQLRGAHPLRGAGELPDVAARWWWPSRSPAASTGTPTTSRSAPTGTAARSS